MEKFQKMVLEELPSLMRYATALTGTYKHAEDLLAICLEHSIKQMEHRDPAVSIRHWLMAIIHNIYMQPENGLQENSLHEQDQAALLETESKFDRLAIQKLQSALHGLPPLQKQVFILVTLEEIPYNDIKAITDLSLANIMSLLHRSRRKIRQHTFPETVNSKVEI